MTICWAASVYQACPWATPPMGTIVRRTKGQSGEITQPGPERLASDPCSLHSLCWEPPASGPPTKPRSWPGSSPQSSGKLKAWQQNVSPELPRPQPCPSTQRGLAPSAQLDPAVPPPSKPDRHACCWGRRLECQVQPHPHHTFAARPGTIHSSPPAPTKPRFPHVCHRDCDGAGSQGSMTPVHRSWAQSRRQRW